ncbi:MAG: hypothetical protein A2939_02485 [Parcubacteria group bacterium RIFCSPLOWO2_01_FULL_48_18]|nr:MAG: hypothetical protein A2939_02485 [Parcubacteria group bacterium RIFCSPLOWO2_01_FULL_48_18]OHB24097.1 MAG: hypothetical protein A3J67_01410 [Parcubacteria group bacterium RIFCSPHIGHO2_02_FULL_48_10b]
MRVHIRDRFSDHPDLVRFNEIECCAIDAAFTNPQHELMLRQIRIWWSRIYTSNATALFRNAPYMGILYSRFEKQLHAICSMAKEEKEFLIAAQGNTKLGCGHTGLGHIEALASTIEKIRAHPVRN